MKEFYSNGKLLLTGEYAVLDGAEALALPTVYGQFLKIIDNDSGCISWKSLDEKEVTWFEAEYDLKSMRQLSSSDDQTSKSLLKILLKAQELNPSFFQNISGCSVKTKLTFPKDWGLGTSSTLINNIANWAKVNPYQLLNGTFGGSGYDIACAQNDTPITYRLIDNVPSVKPIDFYPSFMDSLYFVYLNKKQNSREGIAQYQNQVFDKSQLISEISDITTQIISCEELSAFNMLLDKHEAILSQVLELPTVKESLFHDYTGGSIKSLGAWGGDFILATGGELTPNYFQRKGYHTVIPYAKMILK